MSLAALQSIYRLSGSVPMLGRTVAPKVRGNSMKGVHILDGDTIVLEMKPPHDGAIVAALVDGECTLKRCFVRRGTPYLKAENPKYADVIPSRELVIQGVVSLVYAEPGILPQKAAFGTFNHFPPAHAHSTLTECGRETV